MQWSAPSSIDTQRVFASTRDRSNLAHAKPMYFSRPPSTSFSTSTSSSSSPSPSSPPPPYEDIHVVSKPVSSLNLGAHNTTSYSSDFDFPVTTYRERPEWKHNPGVMISHLRETLDSLDTQMASLLSQRQELESHLDQAVRSQSPIFRLPEELLSLIFVTGVCDAEDEDPLLVSSLMLVCRYWRDVAVNTPELWSTICISPHGSLEKARRRLARSKSVRLDVSINFNPRIDDPSTVTEHIVRAMDLLRPALWRTRSFRLSVPNRPQVHAALLRCQEDAPFLETLSICVYHSMQDDHYSSPCLPLFNGYTPRLKSCSFTSFNFGWDRRIVSGLNVLHLVGYWNGFSPSVDTLLDILRACPDLQEFTLRNISDVDSPITALDQEFSTVKIVKLPRLTKASFYYAGNIRTRLLLSQISFPALESLELSYLDNMTPIIEHLRQQSLTSLPLRHLCIESSFFNEHKFVNLLKRLMSLTTLELVDVEDISYFLLKNLSTPPASHPWVCPKLDRLNFDGCTTLEWDSLRTLVESRLSGKPSQLTSVSATAVSRPVSSASASAYIHSLTSTRCSSPVPGPRRLSSIDVTRCHQISKEMVQWLRMYVRDVRCESVKGMWGEPMLS